MDSILTVWIVVGGTKWVEDVNPTYLQYRLDYRLKVNNPTSGIP